MQSLIELYVLDFVLTIPRTLILAALVLLGLTT
jgi:hypothetical protein